MCGRFYLEAEMLALESEFDILDQGLDLSPRYNIAPSTNILTITQLDQKNQVEFMRWGLVPFWSKGIDPRYSMFNARAETLTSKPAFKKPFKRSRCLIPASGYYEWRTEAGVKQPYAIAREDGKLLALAGVWDSWHDDKTQINSCTIITKEACPQLADLHERMPVVISHDAYNDWLDPAIEDTDYLHNLLRYSDTMDFAYWPVSPAVNSPRHDTAELIKPLSEN